MIYLEVRIKPGKVKFQNPNSLTPSTYVISNNFPLFQFSSKHFHNPNDNLHLSYKHLRNVSSGEFQVHCLTFCSILQFLKLQKRLTLVCLQFPKRLQQIECIAQSAQVCSQLVQVDLK